MTKEDKYIIHHHNKYYTILRYHSLVSEKDYYLGEYCSPTGYITLRGFYIKQNDYYILHGNVIEYTFSNKIISESKYVYGVKVSGKQYYYNPSNLIKYEGNYYNEKMHGLGRLYNREEDYIEINFNMNIPYGIGVYYNSKTKKEKLIEVNKKEWYNVIQQLEWHELFYSKPIFI